MTRAARMFNTTGRSIAATPTLFMKADMMPTVNMMTIKSRFSSACSEPEHLPADYIRHPRPGQRAAQNENRPDGDYCRITET